MKLAIALLLTAISYNPFPPEPLRIGVPIQLPFVMTCAGEKDAHDIAVAYGVNGDEMEAKFKAKTCVKRSYATVIPLKYISTSWRIENTYIIPTRVYLVAQPTNAGVAVWYAVIEEEPEGRAA